MMTTWSILHFIVLSTEFLLISARSQWPVGTYGLPRAQSGCPAAVAFQWRVGWRFQDTEDNFPDNRKSADFHLDASVSRNNLKRHFCTKTDSTSDTARLPWPKGQYCIYKKGSCPMGLTPGYVHWDDDDWFNNNNKGGTLPDGVYNKNTKIYYCCRTDGNKSVPISLPTSKPFFLLAYRSAECQQVAWALASSEWLRFDTEDTGNTDGKGGTHPYGAGMDDHTIHFCYYQSCNHTLTSSNGTFTSPNYPQKYPDGQHCSWRITVPTGYQVSLTFTHFSLQNGTDADSVQVFDGRNETASGLGTFSGINSPTHAVRSTSRDIFVIFRSDVSGGSNGFQASYKTFLPDSTALPTQDVVTSATPAKDTDKSTFGTPTLTTTTAEVTNTESMPTKSSVTTGRTTIQNRISTLLISEPISEARTTSSQTNFTESSSNTASLSTTLSLIEPTHTASEPMKNASSSSLRKAGDSDDEDLAGFVALIACLLTMSIVTVIFIFLYLRKRRSREGKDEDGAYVTFTSSSRRSNATSIDNPLYDSDVVPPGNPYASTDATLDEVHFHLPVFIVKPGPSAIECTNPLYETSATLDTQANPPFESTA